MQSAEDQEALIETAMTCMDEDIAVAVLACMPRKTRSLVGLLSMKGFNMESPNDAAISAMLTKMQKKEPTVDTDLDGDHATELRALHMLAWKKASGRQTMDGSGTTLVGGQATEEAIAASKAVKLYKRLHLTQGVLVPPEEQLAYSVMHKCSALFEKNGTINMQLSINDMKRQ